MSAVHPSGISDREAEVLEALGEHLSNAQIAHKLHISIRTVESHVASLLRKLGVADRRDLAALAPAARAAPVLAGLPTQWTSFVGRSAQRRGALAALAEGRLVSLTGPGGVGKTRLAAEVARDAAPGFLSGCVFIDLVPVAKGFLAQAVAALISVDEEPGQSLERSVLDFLATGQWLLVLDNCEHVLAAMAEFAERLLAACPGVIILATSRERLGVAGERVIAVPPLALTGEAGDPGPSEAEALFLERARAVAPGFTADPGEVSELCARLDGMPLAIELAAARSASLGMPGLLAGLADHLRLLAGGHGADARHHSLRAVIAWSHDLLDADERVLFRGLSMFAGGFDLPAAQAISGDDEGVVADLVGRLTDKSLLTRPSGLGGRWRLPETVRAYARDQLAASGEEAVVGERHLRWAAATAAELEQRLADDAAWRVEFDQVADDLRAALVSAARPDADGIGHQLASSLGHLAYARRFLVEAREHYENATRLSIDAGQDAADLESAAHVALATGRGDVAFQLLLTAAKRAGAAHDDAARAALLGYAVVIANRFAGSFAREVPHRVLAELLSDAERVAPQGAPRATAKVTPAMVATAVVAAARAWNASGKNKSADAALAARAVDAALRTGDPVLVSGALDAAVSAARAGGRIRDSLGLIEERTKLLDQMPRHAPRAGAEIVDTISATTHAAAISGKLPDAIDAAWRSQSDTIMAGQAYVMLSKLVLPLVLQGRFDEALGHVDAMWEAWHMAGRPASRGIGPAVYAAVLVHGLRGDEDGGRQWRSRAAEVVTSDDSGVSVGLGAFGAFADARLALYQGRPRDALATVGQLGVEARSWYDRRHDDYDSYAWAVAAEAAVLAGLPDASQRLDNARPAGAENLWAAACLARAEGILSRDRGSLETSVVGWEGIDARFERAVTLLLIPERADEGRAELTALGCPPPAHARSL